MELNLRKFAKFVDKTFVEGGKKAKEPVLLVSVAAVIKNPWSGKGFVEDLKPEILALAPKIGDILVPELLKEVGSGDKILAYGKAATVGLNGEIEHASAFIHTIEKRQGIKVGSPEEVSWRKGWISSEHLENLAALQNKSGYGTYLKNLIDKDFNY